MEAAKGDFGRLMAGYEVIVCAASREDACALGALSHDAYSKYSSVNPLKIARHCGIGIGKSCRRNRLSFFVGSS